MIVAPHISLRSLPSQPCLLVPNRMNLRALQAIERHYYGSMPICWLVEQNAAPSKAISAYLEAQNASGVIFSAPQTNIPKLSKQLENYVAQGYIIIVLPSEECRLSSAASSSDSENALSVDPLMDATPELLRVIESLRLPVVPLYLGLFNEDENELFGHSSSEPCDTIIAQALPELPATDDLALCLRLSWLEAAAQILGLLQQLEEANIGDLIIDSLLAHPQASLICGADESIISYDEFLSELLPFAKTLRETHSDCYRLGIILPPGRDAILANLACLITGITPVNIDTSLSHEHVRHVINQAELTRFITEERFYQMPSPFSWPLRRDLIMMQGLRESVGAVSRLSLGRLTRVLGIDWARKRIRSHESKGSHEAVLFYSNAEQELPREHCVSNQMILAAKYMLQQRLPLGPGKTVMSTQSYSDPIGFMMGMLFPLLRGCDIVTYPIADALGRIKTLAYQYHANLALTSTQHLRHSLHEKPNPAQDPQQGALTFICYGERLPHDLQLRCEQHWGVRFIHSYAHAGALCLTSMENRAHAPIGSSSATSSSVKAPVCYNGTALMGMGIRICDIDSATPTPQSPSALGMLWLSSAALSEPDEWLRTGDVALISEEGELCIAGKENRFTKLGGQLIAHELLEELLCDILNVKNKGTRQLAVVGVRPRPHAPEKLILLSCVHDTVPTHELIDLRYKLLNRHFPSCWCPEHILPVRRIPELATGKMDYKRAHEYCCRALNIPL